MMYKHGQPFSPGLAAGNPMDGMQLVPRVDVVEAPGEIIYIFEVPGVELNTINVEIGNGNVLVSGQVEIGLTGEGMNYLYQERPVHTKYGRLLSIPAEVDSEKAVANVKNGMLMVRFPKKNTGRRLMVGQQEQKELQQEQEKQKPKKRPVKH